jgi:hypothetical protein
MGNKDLMVIACVGIQLNAIALPEITIIEAANYFF